MCKIIKMIWSWYQYKNTHSLSAPPCKPITQSLISLITFGVSVLLKRCRITANANTLQSHQKENKNQSKRWLNNTYFVFVNPYSSFYMLFILSSVALRFSFYHVFVGCTHLHSHTLRCKSVYLHLGVCMCIWLSWAGKYVAVRAYKHLWLMFMHVFSTRVTLQFVLVWVCVHILYINVYRCMNANVCVL